MAISNIARDAANALLSGRTFARGNTQVRPWLLVDRHGIKSPGYALCVRGVAVAWSPTDRDGLLIRTPGPVCRDRVAHDRLRALGVRQPGASDGAAWYRPLCA